jgi:hypothetical protein
MSSSIPISSSGRVCLCEWSGPVSVSMMVSLLGYLKQAHHERSAALVLVLHLRPSSAKSIMTTSSSFTDVMPALWAYCKEVVIACQGETGLLDQLRRTLCGSVSAPIATLPHPVNFFELIDDAFTHVQELFPHNVLELRRQRIRSGTWSLSDVPTLNSDDGSTDKG